MSTANEKQIGGDHYKTGGIEVWDLFGAVYLQGNIARYVSRWRKKNGLQDLEKAKHYCEKLLEVAKADKWCNYFTNHEEAKLWLGHASLDWVEQNIISRVLNYPRGEEDIRQAVAGINYLIERAKAEGVIDAHRPWKMPDSADVDYNFYRQLGSGDYSVLREYSYDSIPDELAPYYIEVTSNSQPLWVLDIAKCPPELRPLFERLADSIPEAQYRISPRWMQALYELNTFVESPFGLARVIKYVLKDKAWL